MKKSGKQQQNVNRVISIAPYQYIYVKDNNTSVIDVVKGPINYVIQEHEEHVEGKIFTMVVIPPMHYACIRNPVILYENGQPAKDKDGQVKLAHSELQYRFQENYKAPFFLYHGEHLSGTIQKLVFIKQDQSLRLKAIKKFHDGKVDREVGDEWLFYGPGIYYPRSEVDSMEIRYPIQIGPESALKLRATQNYTDRNGVKRKAGEEWLVRTQGTYILEVYETSSGILQKTVIKDNQALHVRALKSYTDCYGKEHKAGEEWLITPNVSTWHIFDVYEILVDVLEKIVLNKDQYVVILDPVDANGKNQKGSKKLVKGETSFFLQSGEHLESQIESVYILNETEALLLQAKEKFVDDTNTTRIPGDKWMIRGPCRFIPSIELKIVERRSIIPLDNKEGIYVRDTKTGNVRSVIGKSYLLEANEELWAKDLSGIEEEILKKSRPDGKGRTDKTRVVTFNCPYNTVLQIYNFKTDKNRIVFGPEYVMLEPDEQFNIMYLSGKTPKVPGVVKTLYLNMGPTYTTDQIEVETSDHALLIIEVSYNWHFDVNKNDDFEKQRKIFSVRDCIGEMCSIMASRVRGAVAEMTLNEFHKSSARVIRIAVMGEINGKIGDKFVFQNNLLAITNVDIKNISTKDEETKNKLQATVNLAIEITTRSQEEEAKRQAERRDQEAKSTLQRKIIEDNSQAESIKKVLFELKGHTQSIEESGMKEAEAKSKVNSMIIDSESNIKVATINKEIFNLKNRFKMENEKFDKEAYFNYLKSKNEIEIETKTQISDIETKKFQTVMNLIGENTLVELSQAGPESQIKLLESLGLDGFVMTDGNNPLNLYDFANNLTKNN